MTRNLKDWRQIEILEIRDMYQTEIESCSQFFTTMPLSPKQAIKRSIVIVVVVEILSLPARYAQ